MEAPKELSIAEIRKYMLENGCKVTNHALVKHFKRFLTNPATQSEARILFKTYVNVLATIKNENNQKYLILRKKYLNECPSDEVAQCIISAPDSIPGSPGGASIISESGLASPFRQPPPYKPPPEVTSPKVFTIHPPLTSELNVSNVETYHELINEMHKDDQPRSDHISCEIKKKEDTNYSDASNIISEIPECHATNISRENSIENTENKENIPRFSFSSGTSGSSVYSSSGEKLSNSEFEIAENPISVKEATRKFNRLASEEEAKVISPPSKKKPEKQPIEEKIAPEVLLAHPKAKEWIVSMARACYQELAKLANEFPELVKLQDPSTTALHWAAKHGNEDVVKLIAGSYKADVNARTNGGYTPLHLAMQFGRENIFELLCNVYKANRDLMDWSGNKPLDYHQQRTSVSQSTYSKIKARRKHTVERDLGFLRIGSLNVRVKKTTEAFSNFLGVGTGNGNTNPPTQPIANIHHQRRHRHHHHVGTTKNHHTHPRMMNTQSNMTVLHRQPALQSNRASVPINITNTKFDKHVHKSWGSADNLPQTSCANESKSIMPPPKGLQSTTKRKKDSKRSSITSNSTDRDSMSSSTSSSNLNSGYSSMPTTPNQLRAPIGISLSEKCPIADSDSDSACGFGSNWSVGRHTTVNGHLKDSKDI